MHTQNQQKQGGLSDDQLPKRQEGDPNRVLLEEYIPPIESSDFYVLDPIHWEFVIGRASGIKKPLGVNALSAANLFIGTIGIAFSVLLTKLLALQSGSYAPIAIVVINVLVLAYLAYLLAALVRKIRLERSGVLLQGKVMTHSSHRSEKPWRCIGFYTPDGRLISGARQPKTMPASKILENAPSAWKLLWGQRSEVAVLYVNDNFYEIL